MRSYCVKRKLISLLVVLTVSVTGIPWIGFSFSEKAYADNGVPATVDEASAALETARTAKQAAEDEKAAAQDSYNTKLDEYNSAATDTAKKLQTKNKAETVYNKAKEETSVKENEKKAAQTATDNAAIQWNNEKIEAGNNLEIAQNNYDNVGISFLNAKAGNELTDAIWFNWLKEKMAGKSFDNITWNNVLETDDFEKGFYSPYSYDNLMRSAELVAEGNALRKSQDPSLSNIKISYKVR